MATVQFQFVDGTTEWVLDAGARYRELIADGHTPVGSVPASDGISDQLEAYLGSREAAQSATYAPLKGRFVDLAEPFFIAHRGGGSHVLPEHTMETYRAAVAAGSKAIEQDVWILGDGALGVMHDSSVDRTGTATGTLDQFTSLNWQQQNLDTGTVFGEGWPDTMHPPLFAQVVAEWGNRVLLVPEVKNAAGQAMADCITQFGVQKSVLVTSAFLAQLTPSVAAGAACALLTSDTLPDIAGTLAAGVRYAIFSTGVADSVIQQTAAGGLKPIIYSVQRRSDVAKYVALGAVGFYSDDPIYAAGTPGIRRTTDPYQAQVYYHGHQPSAAGNRGKFFTPDQFGYDVNTAAYWGVLAGWASPIKGDPNANSFTIDFSFSYDSAAAATSLMTLSLLTSDQQYSDGPVQTGCNGYTFGCRKNGEMKIYKVTNGGTSATLTTVAGTAIADGATCTFRLTVTPTSLRWERLDVSTVATSTDTSYRGGYLHHGRNGVAGKWKDFVIA